MKIIAPIVIIPECSHCSSANVRQYTGPATLMKDGKVRQHLVTRWECGDCKKRTVYRIKQEHVEQKAAKQRG